MSALVACPSFVQDISCFVDGELAEQAGTRLVGHIEACPGCRDLVDALRRLSSVHLAGTAALDRALAATVDPASILGGITRDLLSEKRQALARLFYEVGKAYVVLANKALGERRRQSVLASTPAAPLRTTEARARRLLREAEAVSGLSRAAPVGTTQLFRRSRQLFGADQGSESAALRRGRRFLEGALALAPDLHDARLWLGFQHALAGRSDRARLQFRKVQREAGDARHRLFALQALGKLHAEEGDYRRAIECYEAVVGDEQAAREPGLFPSFLNLAVNHAKAGRAADAARLFADVVRRFPDRLGQVRALLERKPVFRALLERDAALRRALADEVPLLFAA